MTTTAGRILRRASACLALLLVLAPPWARAARAARLPYAVRAWTIADGLSSNRFRGLAVDRAGALWISAEDGTLARRTGNTFAQRATGSTREASALLARIARMLESRHRLRDHLARAAAADAVLGPEAAAAPAPAPGRPDGASKVDTAFLRRVREVVAARLGDEEFGVDELAKAMGMGRTLLFQRTRDLLGATPMKLLMGRRLERAAELFAAAEGNVGEVAYEVGFRGVAAGGAARRVNSP